MNAGELTLRWARALIDALIGAGVRDAVVSPGSRSTPFVLAATERSDLRSTWVVDERAAGFFALGLSRASSVPSLLICTSGTALAHYLPAVLEAGAAGVPLLVLSADRPLDRSDARAPQTIDQIKLFGDHVRHFAELGLPDETPRSWRGLRRRATLAVVRCSSPRPGPVHLNARARKPLEPEVLAPTGFVLDEVGGASAFESSQGFGDERPAGRARGPRYFAARPALDPEAIGLVEAELRAARRPWVVAGPGGLDHALWAGAARRFVANSALPTSFEWGSQWRAGSSGGLHRLVAALTGEGWRERFAADLVLQIGEAPTLQGFESFVEARVAAGARHVVVASRDWPDPVSTASVVVEGPLGPFLDALGERFLDRRLVVDGTWLELAGGAERAVVAAAEPALHEEGFEGAAVRAAIEEVPAGGLLGLGNSLPIRWAEIFGPDRAPELKVWVQRGVNGIDGLVAGFCGSLTSLGTNTESVAGVLVVGDVSLAHDIGALALAARLPRLVILVLDNAGGRIFEGLAVSRLGLEARRQEFFITPTGLDLEAAARAFGLDHARCDRLAELRAAVRRGVASQRAVLIEFKSPWSVAEQVLAAYHARLDSAAKA